MQELKAKINPDGTFEIETSGFKDHSCVDELDKAIKELEALGIETEIKEMKKKPEYYVQGQRTGIHSKSR